MSDLSQLAGALNALADNEMPAPITDEYMTDLVIRYRTSCQLERPDLTLNVEVHEALRSARRTLIDAGMLGVGEIFRWSECGLRNEWLPRSDHQ